MDKPADPTTKLLTCPYNDSHQILRYRYQKHLVKCARQHPHIKLEVCPFNASHRIAPEKFAAHKIECPDRVAFEKYMTEIDIGPWKKEVKKEIKFPKYQDDESWDDLVGQGGYDPKAATEDKPILRRLIGATHHQKRRFYTEERKRLQMLRDKADGKVIVKEETEVQNDEIEDDDMEVETEDDENDDETEIQVKEEPNIEPVSIKNEPIESQPETAVPESTPVIIKEEMVSVKEEMVINPVSVKQEKITLVNPISIKKEVASVDSASKIDDFMLLYKKRQQELQKIIKKLQSKHPNIEDPRLQVPVDGRLRERSLSPIFPDVTSDPRLRVNPFSLMKGKENYRDPRLNSLMKKEREKLKKVLEEEKEQKLLEEQKRLEEEKLAEQRLLNNKLKEAQEKENQLEAMIGDIDILDQLLNEVENPSQATPVPEATIEPPNPPPSAEKAPKTRLRSTSTCSIDSKESGEITDDSEDEVIVIDDSDEDLDKILNSSEFNELKQCALRAKSHTSSDTEGSCSSMKRRSRSSELSPNNRKSDLLEEIVQLRKKIKNRQKS